MPWTEALAFKKYFFMKEKRGRVNTPKWHDPNYLGSCPVANIQAQTYDESSMLRRKHS